MTASAPVFHSGGAGDPVWAPNPPGSAAAAAPVGDRRGRRAARPGPGGPVVVEPVAALGAADSGRVRHSEDRADGEGRGRDEDTGQPRIDEEGGGDPDAGVADGQATGLPWRTRVRLAVGERMPLWVQSRCGLELRKLAALTIVLFAAGGFAAYHFWSGRPETVRAPAAEPAAAALARAGQPTPHASAAGGLPAGAEPSGGSGATIVVDVAGEVRHPGIHRLPAGARVADALKAAGGVRPGTETDALNRARLLADGEQLLVGDSTAAPAPGTEAGAGSGPGAAAPAGPISLNSATLEQLVTLPGVGPVLGQHIIDHREQHGGFSSVEELREVNGIGDKRFADLRPLVQP